MKYTPDDVPELWEEITKYAQELNFEIKEDNILLPIGQINNIQYGFCLNVDDLFMYTIKNGDLELGKRVDCLTHEYIIKTAEIKDRTYIIEKRQDKEIDDPIGKAKTLMFAFKFKDLGTIDYTLIHEINKYIFKNLPKRTAKELAANKISELEEKLIEAEALNIPESDEIIKNILNEFYAYSNPGMEMEIVPKVQFPNIAKRACWHYISFADKIDFGKWCKWCKETGNDTYSVAKELIGNKIIELKGFLHTYKIEDTLSTSVEILRVCVKAAQQAGIYSEIPAMQEADKIFQIADELILLEKRKAKKS